MKDESMKNPPAGISAEQSPLLENSNVDNSSVTYFSLSISQKRLWFLHQYHPTGINNTVVWLKLSGNLDISALKTSIEAVVSRHEALRTQLLEIDGEPRQFFDPIMPISFHYQKFDTGDEVKDQAILQETIQVESLKSFDLKNSPLWVTRLYELPNKEYYFAWVCDHIISDGLTKSVLCNDLINAYNQIILNGSIQFDKPAVGYSELIALESQRSASEIEADKQYWYNKLHGMPVRLDFPTLKRPSHQTFTGKSIIKWTSIPLHDEVLHFCKENNITPFMFFSSVFSLLVYRISGQNDFPLGLPIANRNHLRLLNTVGFFVNTLVLRCRFESDMTFMDHLIKNRGNLIEAYEHGSFPFERIVEMIQTERDSTRSPIFQFFLNTRKAKIFFTLPGEIKGEILAPPQRGSNFDLTVYFQEVEGVFEMEFCFNPNVLAPENMHVFQQQLINLFESVIQNPNQSILNYSLMVPDQTKALPDPHIAMPRELLPSVSKLFTEIAQKFPQHTAITWRGKQFSYQTLQKDSSSIARYLHNKKYQTGDVIALSGASSYGLIVILLGILQAGCVVLLLDPTLPDQRKRLMLDNADAKLLFYSDEDADAIVLYNPLQKEPYHPMDGQLSNIDESYLADCELPLIDPLSPAYITFTSGTTGVPKGILGIHNGLSHFLLWQRETFEIGPGDHFAQLTNIGFDVIYRDILQPLISGASVHCPPNRELIASKTLFSWFKQEKINILHTVPSLARYWLGENEITDMPLDFRLTFFAGEKLTQTDCTAWKKSFFGDIINLYGPSETTLATCYHPADSIHEIQPIGQAIPETQVLILNAALQLAGIGEFGQIAIRSPYRSAGYLQVQEPNPFIPNPFRDDPQDLIYLTGDLGRFLPDGTITFLGRMDQQIKILGNRIEPEEVRRVLLQYPLIQNAVVQANFSEITHWPILIAYVVPKKDAALLEDQIRDYLQHYLSAVSIPQQIIILPSLPLTPNGKIDLAALPVRKLQPQGSITGPIREPRDLLEKAILILWKKHLKIDSIDIHDNFFHLGGHSLMGLSLCTEMEQKLHKKISIATFFQYPTIAQLGNYFKNPSSNLENPILPLQTFGERPPLFCANMRDGSASIYRLLIPYLSPDQPIYGLPVSGQQTKTLTRLEDLAAQHVKTILAFEPQGPYSLLGYSFGGLIAFEIARQLQEQGKEIVFLGIIDTWLEKNPGFLQALRVDQRVDYFLRKFSRMLTFHSHKLRPLSVNEKIKYIVSRLFQRTIINAGDPDHMISYAGDQTFELSNHLHYLSRHYQPKPLQTRITLFRAIQPSTVFHAYPATFGWHFFSKQPLALKVVQGSHYTMVQGNDIQALASQLQLVLEPIPAKQND